MPGFTEEGGDNSAPAARVLHLWPALPTNQVNICTTVTVVEVLGWRAFESFANMYIVYFVFHVEFYLVSYCTWYDIIISAELKFIRFTV